MSAVRWLAFLLLLVAAASAYADGNVTAAVEGRRLVLQGDAGSNWVTIAPGGTSGGYTVTPVNGATVNGASAAQTFRGVRSIVARMGAGDDRVDVGAIKLRGALKIVLEDGNDQVYLTGCAIRGAVRIRCGAGTDTVRTDSPAIFYGSFRARGEKGNDELQAVNAQFRGRLRVDAGDDDDHVLLQGLTCTSAAPVEVYSGPGLDLVELFSDQFGTDAFIDTGPDDDKVRLLNTRCTGDVSVFGGIGEDDVLSLESGNVFSRTRTLDGFEEGQPVF